MKLTVYLLKLAPLSILVVVNSLSGGIAFDSGLRLDHFPDYGAYNPYARDLTADGQVVVGRYSRPGSNSFAASWLFEQATEHVDFAAGYRTSAVEGVSRDGRFMAGYASTASETLAVRWDMGVMEVVEGITMGQAHDVSDEGIIVGWQQSERGLEAFKWDGVELVNLDDDTVNLYKSRAYAITPDGSTIVGVKYSGYYPRAASWRNNELIELDTGEGEALGVSDAGDLIVGYLDERACVWKIDNEGAVSVEYLPETSWDNQSRATGISGDGTVIVGVNPNIGDQAVMWRKVVEGESESWEYVVLNDYLDEAHYNRQDFNCQEAVAITPDGKVIIGRGSGVGTYESYRLWLEKEPVSGTPVAWGSNHSLEAMVPEDLTGVVDVKPAGSFNLALLEDGTVTGWGSDQTGQITPPQGLSNVTSISAGNWHSLAVQDNGNVVAWGDNTNGQSDVPDLLLLEDVFSVSAGGFHSVALKTDWSVEAWGGMNDLQDDVPANLGETAVVQAGVDKTVALLWDGTVDQWGVTVSDTVPMPFDLSNVSSISHLRHTLALRNDGTVAAWGPNEFGQCDVPNDLTHVVKVVSALSHSVALRWDGTVVVWGPDSEGVLDIPDGLDDVVDIAAGGSYTLALKNDGTVVAWGWDLNGRTAVPDDLSDVFAIYAGPTWGVALVEAVPIGPLPPELTVSTETLSPSCVQGENAPVDYIQVTNSGDGTMSFTVGSDVGWTDIVPTDGESSGESKNIAVTYLTSALTEGTYDGIITVTAGGADNSPQQIAVSLTVLPPGPTHWGQFERVDGHFVDTGAWMGWFWVGEAPWIWTYSLSGWIYVPNASSEAGVGWVYIPK